MTRSVESKRVRPVRLNTRIAYATALAALWVLPIIPEVHSWLVGLDEQTYWLVGVVNVALMLMCLTGIITGGRK